MMKRQFFGVALLLFLLANFITAQEDGRIYRFEVLESKGFLKAQNKTVSFVNKEESNNDFCKFSLIHVGQEGENLWRIRNVATDSTWHVDMSSEGLLSTEFQNDDDFTRFHLEQQKDGSFLIRLKQNNTHLQIRKDGNRLGIFDLQTEIGNQTDVTIAKFILHKQLNPDEIITKRSFDGDALAIEGNFSSNGIVPGGNISMEVPGPEEGFGYGVSWYVSIWSMLERPLKNFQIGLPSSWIVPNNQNFDGLNLCPPGTSGRDKADAEDIAQQLLPDLVKRKKDGNPIVTLELLKSMVVARDGLLEKSVQIMKDKKFLSVKNGSLQIDSTKFDGAKFRDWTNQRPFKVHFQTLEGGLGYWGNNRFMMGRPKFRLNSTPNCYNDEVASPCWNFEGEPLECEKMGTVQLSNRLLIPPDGIPFELSSEHNFLGTAWMAMPIIPMQGYFLLQTKEMEDNNQCLTAQDISTNPLAIQNTCSGNQRQLFKIRHLDNGFYALVIEDPDLCLDGNKVDGAASFGGAAFLSNCAFSGQNWKLISGENGYYQLTNLLLEEENKCLEFNTVTGKATMQNCVSIEDQTQNPRQFWKFTGKVKDTIVPTGNHSWTLFFDAANFKGPLAFMLPEMWSEITKKDKTGTIAGRGLDALPASMAGGSMEFNDIPKFEISDDDDNKTVYTRIPRMQYPVDENGEFILMKDVRYYSNQALFGPMMKWFNKNVPFDGSFDLSKSTAPKVEKVDIDQKQKIIVTTADSDGNETSKDVEFPIKDIDKIVDTFIAEGDEATYGLKWNQNPGIYPEYFKKSGNSMEALTADKVPDELNLEYQKFSAAEIGEPYSINAAEPCFDMTEESPKQEFTVTLNDNSQVTYVWYRFIDQPALKRLKLSKATKERIQKRVSDIHEQWLINGQYMRADPSLNLVSIDANAIVVPPSDKMTGFVPIVIRQEKQ